MSVGISFLVIFILILANGYFSASEMALCTARRTRLQALIDEGRKGAQTAMEVQPDSLYIFRKPLYLF